MLYVRFLSSLSPPLDTFATLSKVYRPSQTPHPAMSSKDKGRCQKGAQHRRPRGPLHLLPPYHRPTLLTEFRVTSQKEGFNRMKLIETPQTTLLRHQTSIPPERGTPASNAVRWLVALLFVPPHDTSPPPQEDMKALRSTQEREGREKGGFPKDEGFLGPGGMRKRFALATLRLPQPS